MFGGALKGFDCELQTVITTDASCKGLGAVLTQTEHNGEESTIAYASRSLTPAEVRYSVIEREALACVWGLEHFRQFIWRRKIFVCTDHKPLTKVLTTRGLFNTLPKLAR